MNQKEHDCFKNGDKSFKMNGNSPVEDFKVLYFETLQKLHKLTAIDKTVGETNGMIAQMETNQVVGTLRHRIQQLQQQLVVGLEQNRNQVQQLKRVKWLSEQKESHLRNKYETEVKRNMLASEELVLLKNEIRILTKELQNLKQLNRQPPKKTCKVQLLKTNKQEEHNDEHQDKSQELREIVQRQQRQITIYRRELEDMRKQAQLREYAISKLQSQAIHLQQLHHLQLDAKHSIVMNLNEQINKKTTAINQLQTYLRQLYIEINKYKTTSRHSFKQNYGLDSSDYLQPLSQVQLKNKTVQVKDKTVQVKDKTAQVKDKTAQLKDKTVQRLEYRVHQYEEMVQSYESNQRQLYDELISKDQVVQQLQYQRTQLLQEIQQLRSSLSQLKTDFIHSQLLNHHQRLNTSKNNNNNNKNNNNKNNNNKTCTTPKHSESSRSILSISRIHNKTYTALNNSRLTPNNSNKPKPNLSLSNLDSSASVSRLNSSASTVSSLPFTPINSLNNSRKTQAHNSNQRQHKDKNNQVLKVTSSKTPSTYHNDSSGSFYKHKKLLPKTNAQVTPFPYP